MSSRTVVVVVGVLVLGAGAWWSLGGAEDRAPASRAEPSVVETPAPIEQHEPGNSLEPRSAPLANATEPTALDVPAAAASPADAEDAASSDPAPFESVDGAGVAGRVVTTDGEPLPEARVVLRLGNEFRDGRWRERPEPVGSVLADEHGAFLVDALPDGKLRLTAELDGWVCVQRIEGEVARYEEVNDAELIMAPSLRVSGNVRDTRGAPVEGAQVALTSQGLTPSPRSVTALAAKLAYVGPHTVEARSDATGAFTLEAIAAGSYALSARHEQHPTLTRTEQVDGRALQLRLEDGVALAGIVYGSDGDPLPGTSVKLRSSAIFGPGQIEAREATTDEEGAFRLAGLTHTDSAYVMLLAPGHAVHVVQPQPLDAEGITVAEYDLPAERVIAGVLRDPRGAPIEGIEVSVQGERVIELNVGMHPIPTWEQRSGIESTRTDARGRFRLGQLYEGTFQLTLSREGEFLSTHSVASGTEDLELELDFADFGNVHVSGRVTDSISGLPVPRFKLHVWRPNASGSFSGSPRDVVDIQGRFEVRELNAGLMYLSAEADGYHRNSSAKLEYEAGEHVIDLALAPHRDLQLRVLRPDGSAVVGASLELFTEAEQPIWVPIGAGSRSYAMQTDAQGEAHAFEMPAARVLVKLTQDYGNEQQVESFDLTHPLEGVQTIFLDEELTSRPTRRDVGVMLVVLADDRPADLIGTKREDFLELQTELMPRFVAGEITPLARSIALTFTSAAGDVVEHASYGQNAEGQWQRTSAGGNSWSTSEMPGAMSWDVPVGAGTLTLDIEGKGERTIALPDGSDQVQAMLFFATP